MGLEGDGRVRRVAHIRRVPPRPHFARLDGARGCVLRNRRLPTDRLHVPRRQLPSAGSALLRVRRAARTDSENVWKRPAMNKENILFSVVGVLLGFIVGFAFANTVNQRGAAAPTAQSSQQTAGLPPDHPPITGDGVAGAQPRADTAGLCGAAESASTGP